MSNTAESIIRRYEIDGIVTGSRLGLTPDAVLSNIRAALEGAGIEFLTEKGSDLNTRLRFTSSTSSK